MLMPMPLKKNKSVGEFPRVKISEEFPRVKIPTEFPRKSIVTEPPFGKDIVNLEKKYGTVSGYKMYPFGRAREEFVEDEHPRDEGGQFTLGNTTDAQKPEPIPKPEDRPSGGNYRIEAKKALLKSRIDSETKFIEQHMDQLKDMPEKLEQLRKSVDVLKTIRDNVEAEDTALGLPNIPMRKNTHTKSRDGYVYNKTKIKIQTNVKNDLVYNLLQERVKGMWNSLPDDARDKIDNLIIKKSTAKGSHWQGGRWIDETKTMIINMHQKTSDNLEHNFFHEVGHSKWHDLKRTNPEKVKKFREAQKKIGFPPTAYARSYLMIKERNDDTEANYRRKMTSGGFPISQEGEKRLEQNRVAAEDLYHNEIHSELNAYAMGTLPKNLITAPKAEMAKLLNAYKEMWDLE